MTEQEANERQVIAGFIPTIYTYCAELYGEELWGSFPKRQKRAVLMNMIEDEIKQQWGRMIAIAKDELRRFIDDLYENACAKNVADT